MAVPVRVTENIGERAADLRRGAKDARVIPLRYQTIEEILRVSLMNRTQRVDIELEITRVSRLGRVRTTAGAFLSQHRAPQ
jgi:hypothetical protein